MNLEQQLDLFMQRVNELRTRRLYRQGGGQGFSLNVSRDVNGQLQVSGELRFPDEEDLRSFLLIFRQFVSQNETIYVRKIRNLCYLALAPDDPLRKSFADWHKEWQQTAREKTVGMNFAGPEISPEELADLWINGYYFHNDTDKYERLIGLFSDLTPARINFQTYLTNAMRTIDHLGVIVEEGLRSNAFRF